MNITKKWVALRTLAAAAALGGLGTFLFLQSGLYDIAAIRQHPQVERSAILMLKRNSVEHQAKDLDPPELNQPELVRRGLVVYRKNCLTCHGAPGEARSRVGMGLNPNPPPLVKAAENWTAAEIAWIITYGLKMAGMPGFSLREEHDDLWAVTAFVIRMNTLTPAEYRKMLAATEDEEDEENKDEVAWLAPDQGWQKLADEGNPDRGKVLIREFGCGTCHHVPGVNGANGAVGAPLDNWAKRHYVAGSMNNTPRHLVPWIRNPQKIEPGTVMPNLDISKADAWDLAAYLYSLDGD